MKKIEGFKIRDNTGSIVHSILENRLGSLASKERDNMVTYQENLDKDLDNLTDIKKGSEVLAKAIDSNRHIAVVTDYDSDGLNSAATLTIGLTKIFGCDKKNVTTIVNKRLDGNGFNDVLVNRILEVNKRKPIDLIVTADHGSRDDKAYKKLLDNGVKEIIVTDHHEAEDGILKHPVAFINPQRPDSSYLKSISGCCVAFLLLIRTYKTMFKTSNFSDFNLILPYVAISTITDVMSMKEPFNRHIVRTGLKQLNSLKDKRWVLIKEAIGIAGLVTCKDIGFKIGALINTGNTTGTEELFFKLLVEDDINKIKEILSKCMEWSSKRKELTRLGEKEIMEGLEITNGITAVVKSELPLNGKIAASLGSKVKKPTICFRETENSYEGSGRAIVPGLDLLSVLDKIHEEDDTILNRYGGHKQALGCSIPKDKLDTFKEKFIIHCTNALDKIATMEEMDIDAFIPDFKINTKLAKEVSVLEPYGKDFLEPVFVSTLKVKYVLSFGGAVAKITFVKSTGNDISGIYFFSDPMLTPSNINNIRGKKVHVAYTPRINTFNNKFSYDLEIKKIRIVNE